MKEKRRNVTAINKNKHYTSKERNYIELNWGYKSVEEISRKLRRSKTAIIRYAENNKLKGCYKEGVFLSTSDISKLFKVDPSTVRKYWIEKYGLVSEKKPLISREIHRVSLENLKYWCFKNQDKWSATSLELYALGEEPEWLKKKRKEDRGKKVKRKAWTRYEDNILISLSQNGYKYKEIAIKLDRTLASVKQRRYKLQKETNY